MPKKVELSEIIEKNPHVDPKQLHRSMELLEELREQGVTGRGYELVPPYGGVRVRVVDSSSEDPRTIHLTRRS